MDLTLSMEDPAPAGVINHRVANPSAHPPTIRERHWGAPLGQAGGKAGAAMMEHPSHTYYGE